MIKKKIIPFLAFILLVVASYPAAAVECSDTRPPDDQLSQYIQKCQEKINSLRQEQQSLKSILSLITSKINLTQAQIKSTTAQIEQTKADIDSLSVVITDLNSNLDQLTTVFVSRVRELYKRRDTSTAVLLFGSDSYSIFQKRLKYLSSAQRRDQLIIQELESARVDFDSQKTVKEQKQKEMQALQAQLEQQKKVLGVQNTQKNQLLAQTQADEKKYQSLRQAALARVAELASYTAGKDSSLLSGTTKCDDWGCYYNQRDSQWGSHLIGSSDSSVASVGCLVTSAAMIASHYGKGINPSDIAASTNPFELDTADMRFDWAGDVNGAKVTRTPISCSGSGCLSIIDSELGANRPVIVRIKSANIVGTHFIVITKKEGSNYIMKDPFESDGNNISYTQKHSIDSMSRVDRVSVN